MGTTSGSGTAYPSLSSPPVFSGVRYVLSLVFCGVFCRLLFVCLSFFFWPLYWLSFYGLWHLMTLQTFLVFVCSVLSLCL